VSGAASETDGPWGLPRGWAWAKLGDLGASTGGEISVPAPEGHRFDRDEANER
jgi:hypothetical protein